MKTIQQQRKDIKRQRAMGIIALISMIVGVLFPKYWWVFAPIAVILGGEARVSKDNTSKTLGLIAEVSIALQIVVMYAFCFNMLGK